MAVVSGNGGRLNPWAEPFVPSGVRYRGLQTAAEVEQEVEDFSPEWWRLVAASPAFRDRWLRDYGALGLLDDEGGPDEDAEVVDSFLPDELFSPPPPRQGMSPSRSDGTALGNTCTDVSSILWPGVSAVQRASGRKARPARGAAAGGLRWRRGGSTSGGARTAGRRRPRGTRRRRRGGWPAAPG
jgi:hypothetical protein